MPFLAALLAFACGCGEPPGDPLVRKGIPVTSGAAAGYVPDEVCGGCHTELYRSYQEVGMARSFYRPRADRMIEDFRSDPFHHRASGRVYRMRRDGERLVLERYQLDGEGEPIHRVEVEVDWILGSGHTSRTYLYQTPGGELYQLPVAWYTQTGRWGMAPGFDGAGHAGLDRRVRQECMFCHNAYPEVPAGSDAYGAPQDFPAELPEGIGCQRCHGPGAEHVRAALRDDEEAVLSTLVDLGRLPPERTMEICYGCHYQPTVALSGVRRYGRGIYSFRPGEPLTDYLVPLDVEEERRSRDQRFEINHHPYRLEQSTCFLESGPGELTCLACHDPHRKVPERRRKAHYRDACLACHDLDACTLDAMGSAAGPGTPALPEVAADDCAACHMPRRRTQDVVQVVMTDHRIERRPGGPELLAPLEEKTPILVGAELIRPVPGLSPTLAEIYKASAVLRAGGGGEATDFLIRTLPEHPPTAPEPVLDLVRGLLGRGSLEAVEGTTTEMLKVWPGLVQAREWRALARVQLGFAEGALADLASSMALAGERPEPLFNEGRILFELGRYEESVDSLRRAVDLRPGFALAWAYLGRALDRLVKPDEAESALRRSLAFDPTDPRATVALGDLLSRTGRRAEALRVLEHGARHARPPDDVVRALDETRGAGSGRSADRPGLAGYRSR